MTTFSGVQIFHSILTLNELTSIFFSLELEQMHHRFNLNVFSQIIDVKSSIFWYFSPEITKLSNHLCAFTQMHFWYLQRFINEINLAKVLDLWEIWTSYLSQFCYIQKSESVVKGNRCFDIAYSCFIMCLMEFFF